MTSQPLTREERLEMALREAMRALNDWIVSYASDMCDEASVAETSERIGAYGTLAYVSGVLQDCDAALVKELPKLAGEWKIAEWDNVKPAEGG